MGTCDLYPLSLCALTRIPDIKPQLSNRSRAIELVDNLQISNPQVFPSRAIYDGRANLFSPKELNLSNGTFGSVRNFGPFLFYVTKYYVQYTVQRYTISISKTAGERIDCSWVPA